MRAAGWFIAVILLLAGCVGTGPGREPQKPRPPPGVLGCLSDGTCNFRATTTPSTRQANEVSIAVNPTDPRNMIATGKDYTPEEAGDCVWAGVYTTLDGGKTWKNQNVPGSPWKWKSDPTQPRTEFSNFWCATDPVVAFGPDGTAYWAVMPYQCDPVSASKTGAGSLPEGGLNDWFWTCSSMYVLVSHDKGVTWPDFKRVAVGPRLEHDKEWIAAAPDGTVLMCWDRDTHYATTGEAPVDESNPGQSNIVCSTSTDKGNTWSDLHPLNADSGGLTPVVAFDADNIAYAVYVDVTSGGLDGQVLVASSEDKGTTWGAGVRVGHYRNPERNPKNYNWTTLRGSLFRCFTAPDLAIDTSDGPYKGSLYVTWFDHTTRDGEVRVAYSRDKGKTWQESTRPMDDDPAKRFDQFFPAISVGPDGIVDLSWQDRRLDPTNHLFDTFYAYSLDGGETWSENLRVSEASSDEQYSHHQNGKVFLGDYRDSESSRGAAHLVWVDTRNKHADAYVATVLRGTVA